jgi:hypothetical protein
LQPAVGDGVLVQDEQTGHIAKVGKDGVPVESVQKTTHRW